MQILLGNMGPVNPLPPPVCALLGGGFVFVAVHVYTKTPTQAKLTLEINVVPKAGVFAVAPVAICTIVNVAEGDSLHKGAVLQKTGLGVLYEPRRGVKITNDLLAPENQRVSES